VFSYVCRNAKDLVEGERDVHFCLGHSLTNVELLGFMLLLDSRTITETMYICMYVFFTLPLMRLLTKIMIFFSTM
jgi:hypothetical protein